MYVLRRGDEVQAVGVSPAGGRQPWVIGTFLSLEAGLVTLEGVVPLYGDRERVYETTPTVTFVAHALYVYGAGEQPVFTWSLSQGPLDRLVTLG
jgi:hypothetical protein